MVSELECYRKVFDHLELICVQYVGQGFCFISFSCDCSVLPAPFLEDPVFNSMYIFRLFVKMSGGCNCVGLCILPSSIQLSYMSVASQYHAPMAL